MRRRRWVALGIGVALATLGVALVFSPADWSRMAPQASQPSLPSPSAQRARTCERDLATVVSEQVLSAVWSRLSPRLLMGTYRGEFTRLGAPLAAEEQRVVLLDMRSMRTIDFGVGRNPRWSAADSLIAFERTIKDAEMLMVVAVEDQRVLATLPIVTGLGWGWRGEELLRWDAIGLRAWTRSGDQSIIAPRPIAGVGWFSADGLWYALEVPTSETTERVALFSTTNWAQGPTDEVAFFAWSVDGHVSVWGTAGRTDLRHDATTESLPVDVRSRQVVWDVSGRQPLLGPVAPAERMVELVDLHQRASGVVIPAALTPIGFSADGAYFAGLTGGGRGPSLLRITTCTQ